ncbi:MAG TPA: heme-binding domain-containing protein [Terracidiphilus sp.]|jgi:cytochrome c|nr:heme-binding domain-containing protein [Terracidiphilus sp.]
MLLRPIGFGALFLALTSVALSFVHPWGDVRRGATPGQMLEGSAVPQDVRGIVERKCADCHSNQTHWPVYSRLAPVSWLMEHDVYAGRSAMNLSLWAGMDVEDRIALLARISAEVRSGDMPPKPYAMMHAAALSDTEKQEIAAWARAERKRIRTETSGQKEKK